MADRKLPVARKALETIKPYVPGKPIEEVERELGIKNAVKMASNENPLGPSPRAVVAMQELVHKVHLYPDGSCHYLRGKLADAVGVGPDQIIVGNGSDEIIKLLAETYINPGNSAVMANPSFSEYDFAVNLMGGECRQIACVDFKHDLESMAKAITPDTKLVFICNPNNPTGTIVTKTEVGAFMSRVPEDVVVVFDEAYYEYVSHPEYCSGLEYVKKGFKNVIVLRTFSKIYGLSGLRVGYGIAHPELISWISRTREPFNVNSMAQVAARAAIDDEEHVALSREENQKGKELLYGKFEEMDLPYWPTETNFIWVNIKTDCRPVFQAMLREGVIIRTGDIFGFPEFIRVTIGTEEQNQRFIRALTKVLGK
ncbi:histidinol-phosphate transaminase [Zhaonella formicivorans]|uniref:histidinol-phosphate transaminase n=1 Tax=Zhaonella formicivorans TaxID=2528593 RepID=UPI0010DEB3BE|nr:histidinol-phosphate transaminase [Zhaonella formicivorans]